MEGNPANRVIDATSPAGVSVKSRITVITARAASWGPDIYIFIYCRWLAPGKRLSERRGQCLIRILRLDATRGGLRMCF